jgi:CRISPR-associated endonuclease Csn1
MKTLGLDLGSNSLGWAVLEDTTGEILDKGVIVFPEGVDAKDSVETPAAVRRAARMSRRMKFRRKMRKWNLLKLLIANKMCPLTLAELEDWIHNGKYPLANRAFIQWLAATDTSNPYCDRNAAVEGPVAPFTLGRALYHICQRRGFKSSRKDANKTSEGDEEGAQKKKSDASDSGVVKSDIKDLTAAIQANHAKTLGQYFYRLLEKQKGEFAKKRVRKIHTGRIEHYEKEFATIMEVQNIPGDLRDKLHAAIFWQRPLRSQSKLVGHCPLEKKCKRARIGHPAVEEFRMWSFINNLSFEDANGNKVELTLADKQKASNAFMKASSTFKFAAISKLFKDDPRFKNEGYRFHYYDDKEILPSCFVYAGLKKFFTLPNKDFQKDIHEKDFYEKDSKDKGDKDKKDDKRDDESIVFNALLDYEDDQKLTDWFKKNYPHLSDEQIKGLLSIQPRDGYAAYSLKAIRKILPYLRKGYKLPYARFLAKIKDIVPKERRDAYKVREDEVICSLNQRRFEYQKAIQDFEEEQKDRLEKGMKLLSGKERKKSVQPLYARYQEYLVSEWDITPKDFEKKLYLRDDNVYQRDQSRLPKVQLGMIRNPLVQRSMTILRKLVNYLHHIKHIIDKDTTIRIELAREVNNYAMRNGLRIWQKKREALRANARETIAELGYPITDDNIDACILWNEQTLTKEELEHYQHQCKVEKINLPKDVIDRYILWTEQEHRCIYTGKIISLKDVLNSGTSGFDIEHTVPRARLGDDSLANKTLCDAHYNREIKKAKLPCECPNWKEPKPQYSGTIQQNLLPFRIRRDKAKAEMKQKKSAARSATTPEAIAKAKTAFITARIEFDYWNAKIARFEMGKDDLTSNPTGFKNRQLVDTGIMCSHAVDLLKSVYKNVYSVNGEATAFARKAWGIQSDDEAKDRSEHTHHAKDAMVIAALTPSRFNAICAALKDDGQNHGLRPCDVCPAPWPNFAADVFHATDEILVKHIARRSPLKKSSKCTTLAFPHPPKGDPNGKIVKDVRSHGDTVRGQLHEATFYARIKRPNPKTGKIEEITVIRKPLENLSIPDARKLAKSIVDRGIQRIVEEGLDRLEGEGKKFVEHNAICMPKGVPINRVRIIATATKAKSPIKLRDHTMPSKYDYKTPYYVGSGNESNFRLSLLLVDGKPIAKAENLLAWAQNHKRNDYTPLDQQPGFIGYITPGTMALTYEKSPDELKTLSPKDLRKRLYKVTKFDVDGGTTFRFNSEARAITELEKYLEATPGKSKKGESKINYKTPNELLRMAAANFIPHMLFEGIDFKMNLDGSIKFNT